MIIAVGASDRTGLDTFNSSSTRTSLKEYFLSMFRRPDIEPTIDETSVADPVATVFAFLGRNLWATMSALPVSALQTTIKCDVYSKDGTPLSANDQNAFRSLFASEVTAMEDHYAATKFIRFEGVPDQLPELRAHLQLERRAGREIWPAKREGGNSKSFCKAEKRKFSSSIACRRHSSANLIVCNELDDLAKTGRNAGHARIDNVYGDLSW